MKKMKLILMGIALLSLSQTSNIFAQTGKEIAFKVYNRPTAKDGESDMKMTLINKKGGKRIRNIHQFYKDYGKVEKKILFFKSPADVKNTSFMNWSYDDANKDDDQWLYLPALKKVKRISSSSKDNEFMGSDFTYADMEKRHPDEDVHKLLKSENLNGEDCWVVEAVPVDDDDMYSKKVAWISKSKLLPMKMDYYDEDGELLKTLTINKIQKVGKYWVITDETMHNIQKNHKTNILISNMKVDQGLSDSKFTQRAMRKGL